MCVETPSKQFDMGLKVDQLDRKSKEDSSECSGVKEALE